MRASYIVGDWRVVSAIALAASTIACSGGTKNDPSDTSATAGLGGQAPLEGQGGSMPLGGSGGSAGSNALGGSGGTAASGGSNALGGSSTSGGSGGVGGSEATGGSPAGGSGGSSTTGGSTASGGSAGVAGSEATAGAGGSIATGCPEIGDPTAIVTESSPNGTLYFVPGLSEFEANHGYRYIGIVTGSEPGANGHPGMSEPTQSALLGNLATISERVARDLGSVGLLAGDGSVTPFEAYVAKALGSVLYRPFYAKEAQIDDTYGLNWQQNLQALVDAAGGISCDSLEMIRVRVANGQPIATGQNGATEYFDGIGREYQPYDLRNDSTFSRTERRLNEIIATL